jgi:hypothetical protein
MGKWYLSILPMVLLTVGTFLRGKDADDKGPDDAIGKVLIAAAPAVEALQNNNESGVRKALKATRDTIDAYLASPVSS